MVLNNEGTLLATASDKGTIIRVFSLPDAHKLYQFRRGSMPSRIFSMSFNITSTLLCVSSATDTIHIFKLGPQTSPNAEPLSSPGKSPSFFDKRRWSQGSESPLEPSDEMNDSEMASSVSARKPNGTFMGLIRRTSQNVGTSLATTMGGYLPKGVTEMWEPARDFAWIKIPKANSSPTSASLRSVVAMSSNTPQVMVVTNEGNFYVFTIDLVKGGEGSLTKQYS
jgi:autophagy-related protein 18